MTGNHLIVCAYSSHLAAQQNHADRKSTSGQKSSLRPGRSPAKSWVWPGCGSAKSRLGQGKARLSAGLGWALPGNAIFDMRQIPAGLKNFQDVERFSAQSPKSFVF